jgi:hypothetical protein
MRRWARLLVAVHDERRHVELLEIFGLVRFEERFDALEDAFDNPYNKAQCRRIFPYRQSHEALVLSF